MSNPNTSISSHQCTVTPPADGSVATTVHMPGPYKIEIDLRMTIMKDTATERWKKKWMGEQEGKRVRNDVTQQWKRKLKEDAKDKGKNDDEAETEANHQIKTKEVQKKIDLQVGEAAGTAAEDAQAQDEINKMAARGDPAYNLPYVLVREADDEGCDDIWKVLFSPREPDTNKTSSVIGEFGTTFYFSGTGKYRVYAKEPTMLQPNQGENFSIPYHSSAPADDRLKKPVMPVFSFKVEEASQTEFKITYGILDNPFHRGAGKYSPNKNIIRPKNKKIELGSYVITPALWGDAMPAYGTDYLKKINDIPANIRPALERIYSEELQPDNDVHGNRELKPLTWTSNSGVDMSIKFDNQATDGGHGVNQETAGEYGAALSFISTERMSRSESLRRTHPSVFIWWMKAMEEIKATGARITGAWRPHTGGTRHRYSVALDVADLTKAERAYPPDPMPPRNVVIHFNHSQDGGIANPTKPAPDNPHSMEYFQWQLSREFFNYVIKKKHAGELAWLGGPWLVFLTKTGELSSHQYDGNHKKNETIFNTDDHHKNHVHLSIGTDQKGGL